MIVATLCSLLLLAAVDESAFQASVRSSEPQSAEQQATQFHVPAGFEVQLVAAEPDLQKPMNLAFDARGRLWVSGSIEYPWAAQGVGRDTIKVLQDTNNDGRADHITTFVDGLNIPIGLYPYGDGVVAYTISEIAYFRDTDGDGHSDRKQTLYGPLDTPVDTHGMQNSFRRGADGWLYINHGYANRTTLRGSDGSEIQMHSGNTYRVRLDGTRVEQFSWGQVNPFGSAFTELGDLITADCHSKPLTLVLPGAHYSSFGKPDDGLGFAPELMSHHHGSTGLAGVAYDAGGDWPDEYRHNMLVGNVVTSRIHRDRLVFEGATASAVEQADFLTCDDPWFRPVDLRFGPDGALYIADFYNRIIGHYEVPLEHPGRDRASGRIWRVVYRGKEPTADRSTKDLSLATAAQLIAALGSSNRITQDLALDQLTDRVGAAAIPDLQQAIRQAGQGDEQVSRRVGSRWALQRLGACTATDRLNALSQETTERGQIHALRLMKAANELSPSERIAIVQSLTDRRSNVRRIAADALSAHPHANQIRPLLQALEAVPATDPVLRHSLRIALRNHLRDETIVQQLQHLTLTDVDEHELRDIAVAVPEIAAAEWLLEQLEAQFRTPSHVPAATPVATLGRQLQHVARYASPSRLADVTRVARAVTQGDVRQAATVFQQIYRTTSSGDAAQREPLLAWGRELASQLTALIQQTEVSWRVAEGDVVWNYESRTASDGQTDRYLSSLPGGEVPTGRLVSPTFAAPTKLTFYLCGHRGDPTAVTTPPGDRHIGPTAEVDDDTYVQLCDTMSGEVLMRAYAPRHDVAERIEWNCQAVVGRPVRLELVDRCHANAYAWLAVARIEPAVIVLPQVLPSELATWQQWVAELVTNLRLDNLRDTLRQWIQSGAAPSARSAAGIALAQLDTHPLREVAATLLNDASLSPATLSELTQAVLANDDSAATLPLLNRLAVAPQAKQAELAEKLAASGTGANLLLEAMEHGKASAHLLRRARLREQMLASSGESMRSRLVSLIESLPREDDQLPAAIQVAVQSYDATPDRIAAGELIFTKSCRTCHQVKDVGALIGPQLNGIGNRGLARIAEDVLAPYQNVDVGFRTTIVNLDDGRVLSGLVRSGSGNAAAETHLTLITSEAKEIRVDRQDVELLSVSPLSIMPDNFLQTLTAGERQDLFAFLMSLK